MKFKRTVVVPSVCSLVYATVKFGVILEIVFFDIVRRIEFPGIIVTDCCVACVTTNMGESNQEYGNRHHTYIFVSSDHRT